MKHILLPLLLLLIAIPAANSQEQPAESRPLTLTGYGFYDTHYATGSLGGGALMLDWQVAPAFTLGIGAEYASSNRISARLTGQATCSPPPASNASPSKTATSGAISRPSTYRSSPEPSKWVGTHATSSSASASATATSPNSSSAATAAKAPSSSP